MGVHQNPQREATLSSPGINPRHTNEDSEQRYILLRAEILPFKSEVCPPLLKFYLRAKYFETLFTFTTRYNNC
jgi:hypothetical protein